MTYLGTRPILQDELRQYELHHRARIAIKPGITGMWQVSGRSDITDFEEVVRLDTEYISNWNFSLDMGISMGGAVVTMSSNLDFPDSVCGIIEDSGFTTSTKMLELNCKSHLPKGMPVEVFKIFADVGIKLWGGFNLKEADACKAVSQTKIPILIIHGDMDNLAPLYMAKEIYNSCKSSKEIYIVHGATHAENYRKDPEGYENVIAQFVEEHSGALKKEY